MDPLPLLLLQFESKPRHLFIFRLPIAGVGHYNVMHMIFNSDRVPPGLHFICLCQNNYVSSAAIFHQAFK